MTGDVIGLEALMTLRRLGVGVEIDDFGTGYSSISYLRRLPIDTVKVDQSLVRDIATDGQQVGFVSAILRLIESVGLRAVAEGIETAEQRDQLRLLGCLYGQGHYFSEPVPAHQLTQLLYRQHTAADRPSTR
jgi:EAL domain-containing protein (putative c-di-GMP-specific phosphodiesterase class I)